MSPLILLSLMSVTLFLPAFSDGDDSDDQGTTPEPTSPEDAPGSLLAGTDGADTLSASDNDTVNAGDGDDTLGLAEATTTGAQLNGEDGADTLTLTGSGNSADGGLGQDTLILSGDNTASGGLGDDTITANDTAGSGDATLNGGGGEDLLIKDLSDTPGDLRVEMNGGNGNDTLQADLLMADTLSDAPDILSGGAGADVFRLVLQDDDDATAPDAGLLGSVEITDFDRTEDQLILDIDALGPEGATRTVDSTVLNVADDGSYTDVTLTFQEDATPVTLRLLGVSGLTTADLSFATA